MTDSVFDPTRDRIIVCAANRTESGLIICGARHHDMIMQGIYEALPPELRDKTMIAEQGFIDQYSTFHNRVDALAIVKESGQPYNEKRNGAKDELYSEGLY